MDEETYFWVYYYLRFFAGSVRHLPYRRVHEAAEHRGWRLERDAGLPGLQRDLLPPLHTQIPQVYC